VPMGVIGAIYEARPNVTVDIAVLALKSGNATVLRGGSAAQNSNAELISVLRSAVESVGLPADTVNGIDQYGRDGANVLMHARAFVDLLIPRGRAPLPYVRARESMAPSRLSSAANVSMFRAS